MNTVTAFISHIYKISTFNIFPHFFPFYRLWRICKYFFYTKSEK